MAKQKAILIAEDEKPMATALKLKLSNEGYDVVVAFDGKAALEAIDARSFDLMLLDLMMPKLDGFGVLEALQKKGKKVKTIVSSNLSQPEDFERAKELGAVDYFVKSDTSISAVVKHVQDVLT